VKLRENKVLKKMQYYNAISNQTIFVSLVLTFSETSTFPMLKHHAMKVYIQ